jgi:hypothetical protein
MLGVNWRNETIIKQADSVGSSSDLYSGGALAPTIPTQASRGFRKSLQANSGILSQLHYNRVFLSRN